MYVSVYPSHGIHVVACGPIGTKIWHTHADSSPNGSELNKNQLRVTQGGTWGVLRDHKLTNVGKLPNRWIDRHQIVHTYADSSRNEHRLKRNYPLETPWGHLGG